MSSCMLPVKRATTNRAAACCLATRSGKLRPGMARSLFPGCWPVGIQPAARARGALEPAGLGRTGSLRGSDSRLTRRRAAPRPPPAGRRSEFPRQAAAPARKGGRTAVRVFKLAAAGRRLRVRSTGCPAALPVPVRRQPESPRPGPGHDSSLGAGILRHASLIYVGGGTMRALLFFGPKHPFTLIYVGGGPMCGCLLLAGV